MNTSDTAAVRAGEELDWSKLSSWLKQNITGLSGEMRVSQFHGGHANLTYCLSFDNQELVVRRQPFGDIAPGAHDMKREFRALTGLNQFLIERRGRLRTVKTRPLSACLLYTSPSPRDRG